MDRINTIEDAWKFCEENGCSIVFNKAIYRKPKSVEVSMGIDLNVLGNDLLEAVNRLVDMYNTPPIKHEELEWWEDYLFLKCGR